MSLFWSWLRIFPIGLRCSHGDFTVLLWSLIRGLAAAQIFEIREIQYLRSPILKSGFGFGLERYQTLALGSRFDSLVVLTQEHKAGCCGWQEALVSLAAAHPGQPPGMPLAQGLAPAAAPLCPQRPGRAHCSLRCRAAACSWALPWNTPAP